MRVAVLRSELVMRAGRLVFEGVLLIALFFAGFLLYLSATRVAAPYLPHFIFVHDGNILTVQGTWRREDGDDAWPSQTTTIECERAKLQCTEASAVLARGDRVDSLMPVVLNRFRATEWDGSVVVAQGSTALCIEETYQFYIATQSVTGLVSRKSTDTCNSVPGSAEAKGQVRLRMIDGYEASRKEHWPSTSR
jgi:hypothetical protein